VFQRAPHPSTSQWMALASAPPDPIKRQSTWGGLRKTLRSVRAFNAAGVGASKMPLAVTLAHLFGSDGLCSEEDWHEGHQVLCIEADDHEDEWQMMKESYGSVSDGVYLKEFEGVVPMDPHVMNILTIIVRAIGLHAQRTGGASRRSSDDDDPTPAASQGDGGSTDSGGEEQEASTLASALGSRWKIESAPPPRASVRKPRTSGESIAEVVTSMSSLSLAEETEESPPSVERMIKLQLEHRAKPLLPRFFALWTKAVQDAMRERVSMFRDWEQRRRFAFATKVFRAWSRACLSEKTQLRRLGLHVEMRWSRFCEHSESRCT